MLTQPGSDRERLSAAFERVTSRSPNEGELKIISAALERERRRYQADPLGAEHLLAVGESARNPDLPATEHAAWTNICALLLNLSEAVTRR
jgi:hypothetical protein